MGMHLVERFRDILLLADEKINEIKRELLEREIITTKAHATFTGQTEQVLFDSAVRGTKAHTSLRFPMWIEIIPQISAFRRSPAVVFHFHLKIFMFEPRSMRLFWYPQQGRIPENLKKVSPDNIEKFLYEDEKKSHRFELNSFYHLKRNELVQKVMEDKETVYVLRTWFSHYSSIFDKPIEEFDYDRNVLVVSFLTKEQAMLARPVYVELTKQNKAINNKKLSENKNTYRFSLIKSVQRLRPLPVDSHLDENINVVISPDGDVRYESQRLPDNEMVIERSRADGSPHIHYEFTPPRSWVSGSSGSSSPGYS